MKCLATLSQETTRGCDPLPVFLLTMRLCPSDITEGERRKAERVVNAHRKAAKEAEQYARSLLTKVELQQVRVAGVNTCSTLHLQTHEYMFILVLSVSNF